MTEDRYPKRTGGSRSETKNRGKAVTTALICIAAVLAIIFGALIAVDQLSASGKVDVADIVSRDAAGAKRNMSDGVRVLLDAGHGGFDPGAMGGDTKESEINLAITLKLRDELTAMGYAVEMTREKDEALADTKDADMEARRKLIYGSDADIVVSVHMNSLPDDPSVAGPIVFCYPGAEQGKRLAECVRAAMNERLAPKREKEVKQEDLLVLRAGNAPAILVECGFLSNGDERERLNTEEYQSSVALSIAEGVSAYVDEALHEEIGQ